MTEKEQAFYKAVRLTVELSRLYAQRGNVEAARRMWLTASKFAGRCGGISGAAMSAREHGVIYIDGIDRVVYSPVPLR